MAKLKASVIICTYNRSELLKSSIQAVLGQDFARDLFEIIVVDNNSRDGTADAVRQMISAGAPVRYFFEPRQGLSCARNTGIANAAGEIIVFTDDDIDADRSWLSSLVNVFEDPAVSCAGGPIKAVWPSERPGWLTDDLLPYLTVSEFPEARESGAFKDPHYPWGANIAFRRDVFETLGLFPVNLGRTGTSLLSNEEIMLCRNIDRSGRKIAFAADAVIHHRIPADRMHKLWFYHRAFWQGRSEAITDLQTKSNVYDRLERHAAELLHFNGSRKTGALHDVCYEHILLGYLHQLITAGEGNNTRRLRAFRRFVNAMRRASEQDKQQAVQQMINSTSWKITEPFRQLADRINQWRK